MTTTSSTTPTRASCYWPGWSAKTGSAGAWWGASKRRTTSTASYSGPPSPIHRSAWKVGVLASTRRSEPSRGRGRPSCFPSREEFAHGEEQARKREYDEHDLVDVLFARRQSAYEVRCPEQWVIPQGEPSPPFTASVRNRGDQEAEHPHPDRRHADRSQVWRVTRSGHHRDDEAKDEDG